MFDLQKIARTNIINLKPYSSARDEYKQPAVAFLDANENAFGSATAKPFNRYPDPLQWDLKNKISEIKNIPTQNIFLGNGSDEPIDLIMRCFCNPGIDNIIIAPPTYGMYEVCAHINEVHLIKVLLNNNFDIDADEILKQITPHTKLIFICSPNNPTGNVISTGQIAKILNSFHGIVVLDEAYIDFCPDKSMLGVLLKCPNLVILQTFSKAWGLASIRIGMAFANIEIIQLLNKVKPPYNIGAPAQILALEALHNIDKKEKNVTQIILQRKWLEDNLALLPIVQKVYPSDANFLLVKFSDPQKIYEYLISKGIIVRDRSKVAKCEGCLRITVGTGPENKLLIDALERYQ